MGKEENLRSSSEIRCKSFCQSVKGGGGLVESDIGYEIELSVK